MIQRIQTIFLLLSAFADIICLSSCIGHFYYSVDGRPVFELYNLYLKSVFGGGRSYYNYSLFVILLIACTLTMLAIFLYKKRALQMRVTSLCMILTLGWYAPYVFFIREIASGIDVYFRWPWTVALPAVSAVFLFLAFRWIMKDEMLVRSLDRLR